MRNQPIQFLGELNCQYNFGRGWVATIMGGWVVSTTIVIYDKSCTYKTREGREFLVKKEKVIISNSCNIYR